MTAHSPMQYVHDGRVCIGFIYRRGVAGYEAFDANGSSLGMFATTRAAYEAISAKVGADAVMAGAA